MGLICSAWKERKKRGQAEWKDFLTIAETGTDPNLRCNKRIGE